MRSAVFAGWLLLQAFCLLLSNVAGQATNETKQSTGKTPEGGNNTKTVVKWIGVAAGSIILITVAAFLIVFCVLKKRKDHFMKGQSPAEFELKDDSEDKDRLMHTEPVKNHLPETNSDNMEPNPPSETSTRTLSRAQLVATSL